jgi:hypothetical protein
MQVINRRNVDRKHAVRANVEAKSLFVLKTIILAKKKKKSDYKKCFSRQNPVQNYPDISSFIFFTLCSNGTA